MTTAGCETGRVRELRPGTALRRAAPRLLALALVASAAPAAAGPLFFEDFEALALGPTVTVTLLPDANAWTNVPPAGWLRDNLTTPAGPPAEFFGWTFVDKDWWIATTGDQARSSYSGGDDTIAVADADTYDDGTEVDPNLFVASLRTPAIAFSGVEPGKLVLAYDSSWRYEDSQEGHVEVSFDGGVSFELVRDYVPGDPVPDVEYIDERVSLRLDNPSDGSLVVRWTIANAGNDWWWAIDHVEVTTAPEPSRALLLAVGAAVLSGAWWAARESNPEPTG